jgi:hypothetical protein
MSEAKRARRTGSGKTPLPDLPLRADYGEGCFRRCIVLESSWSGSRGEVRGELADDFHHFAIRLGHDDQRALQIEGEDVRVPWTTCPGALEPLRRMEGAPLSQSVLEIYRHTFPREQCTHLHDLACLAIAHATRSSASNPTRRRYDAVLPDPVEDATRPTLARDGEPMLQWSIEGTTVKDSTPPLFSGLRIGSPGFQRALLREQDCGLAEAAWVLQRAVFIGMGRRHDFERIHSAKSSSLSEPSASCTSARYIASSSAVS